MTELNWQDPPGQSSKAREYDAIVEQLKRYPGRWALIKEDNKTSTAPQLIRAAGCETKCRRHPTEAKTWKVYARWPVSEDYPAWQPGTVGASKAAVDKAVASGTALQPPAPRRPTPPSGGFTQFLKGQTQ
ncbi:hypothetical protein V1638_04140 [Pseudarthrobacter sp. J64]|uniref:hypothetical protein n=1 Tax=Pseudarthrobacter sp. J64 TaxID=3116485 RepID=UPI002E81E097|nr:hypothetical protein [Pseudarthrobacter sp. J64]MEE2568587.1 hypothetical protein [Pseudarthrobacter sp. J64]